MRGFGLALIAGFLMVSPLFAQASEEEFVINLRDTEITILAEQVAEISGRTLIVHPDLRGEITVVSADPLDAEGAWELFQSILRVRGFQAVQSGAIWQVLPLDAARTASRVSGAQKPGSQDFVTRLVPLNRLPASEAVRVLRPLVAASGSIEALEEPNAVLITDTFESTAKIMQLVADLDQEDMRQSRVLRFKYAEAGVIGVAIAEVLGPDPTGARLSVDPGSNTLLVRGLPEDLEEIEALARSMDIPPEENPQVALNTEVIRLRFGEATQVAELVRATLEGSAGLTNPVADSLENDSLQSVAASADTPEVSVQASTELNAVVVRGTNAQIREVVALVTRLDQRRAQVLIEAAIVEVSGDVAQRLSAQLGFGDLAPPGGLAATSFSNGGVSLGSVLSAIGVPNASLAPPGGTFSIGNDNFGLLLQALNQTSKANLLSTPSLTTLDNQAASIVVGQNVPFRTGSFATDGNTVQPFTTIERRDVGITMNVLPRVNAGDVVRLDISQEVSSLVNANLEGAADLITNRRSIQTSVLADDGATIVLGGLITRDDLESLQKVPGAGDIPLLGNLFRSRSTTKNRRTLFVFLKPTILRSAPDIRKTYDARLKALSGARAEQRGGSKSNRAPVRLEIGGLY
ncbi:type II secretion system secretin GspD [Roseobacter sp. YSTF-M11]|uniref:Type II secretion system secretin GspD n=1 Tax=Roseobacter insulae TaxID=2859783 RepID=A0A9X1FU35_9RHOB|nr:type II secretion system secretin GspD [Roseobacter insulae]MBW4707434.1 type II secretion system secretin GspD [Roseobacter insulae]